MNFTRRLRRFRSFRLVCLGSILTLFFLFYSSFTLHRSWRQAQLGVLTSWNAFESEVHSITHTRRVNKLYPAYLTEKEKLQRTLVAQNRTLLRKELGTFLIELTLAFIVLALLRKNYLLEFEPEAPEVEETSGKEITPPAKRIPRIQKLVDDLSDLESFELGRMELHCESIQAEDILNEAIAAILPYALSRQVQLESRILAKDLILRCDRQRVVNALLQLLENAIRYTVAETTVVVILENRDNQAVFVVADNGSGIEDSRLGSLLTESNTQNDSRGSSGFGLPICRAITQAHGGKLWAESKLGKGSKFYLSLPAQSIAIGLTTQTSQSEAQSNSPNSSEPSVISS